jgi:hypothetical protein
VPVTTKIFSLFLLISERSKFRESTLKGTKSKRNKFTRLAAWKRMEFIITTIIPSAFKKRRLEQSESFKNKSFQKNKVPTANVFSNLSYSNLHAELPVVSSATKRRKAICSSVRNAPPQALKIKYPFGKATEPR